MEDYINMFIRSRVVRCDGKYYESFNSLMLEKSGEKLLAADKLEPPFQEGILKNGLGIHTVKYTKEKPISVKIPFMPTTFTSIQ